MFRWPYNHGKICSKQLQNSLVPHTLKNSHSEISPGLDLSLYLMNNSQIYETKPVSLSLSFLDLTCPDDCINPSQGICDKSTGICDCKPGFAGHNCAGDIKYYTYKKYWSWKTERNVFYLIYGRLNPESTVQVQVVNYIL